MPEPVFVAIAVALKGGAAASLDDLVRRKLQDRNALLVLTAAKNAASTDHLAEPVQTLATELADAAQDDSTFRHELLTAWHDSQKTYKYSRSHSTDTGTVKWFNNDKGYGFIQRADGGPDVFVHYSEIQGEGLPRLEQGQQVSFSLGGGSKGPLTRVDDPEKSTETNAESAAHRESAPAEPSRSFTPAPFNEDDVAKLFVKEFTVQIYLESQEGASTVDQSVLSILQELDAKPDRRPPPVIGSWFREFKATAKKTVDCDPFSDLGLRVERAAETKLLHEPQAQIDSATIGAAADLIKSLDVQKNALVQIGSLLLLKVDGDLVVRNLTQRELAFMQRNPGSAANAKEILHRLQGVSSEDLRTATIMPTPIAHQAVEMRPDCLALTGKVWTSGELHSLSVTNASIVPVRNVWAFIEGSASEDGHRVAENDIPVSVIMPGQSAMLNILGNGHPQWPLRVTLHGEGPIGEAVECVIKVEP